MTHWLALPIILPAFLAPFIIFAARHHPRIQHVLSLCGVLALNIIAAHLVWATYDGSVLLYQMGDWAAPFGIVLVADRLSAMMVLLTTILAFFVLLYVISSGWDRKGANFCALYQFQLMGIIGAFLTGDLFNLFVFFEVLLIASYGLMIHGGGNRRLKAGTQYVLYNLLGSTLFLFALGAIYAEIGTLNMADLGARLAAYQGLETAGIRVAAVLLILVFAIKAALFPLHFWLPSSYAEAPAPIAALFSIMTKVGVYAIIRVYTLIFGPHLDATAGLHDTYLVPAALATIAVGALGVLAAKSLDRLVAFSVIGSMGVLMVAVGQFTQISIAAALYYMIHSTFAAAILFLVIDLIRHGRADLALTTQAPISGAVLTSALFFIGAIAMTGLPPLSGFVGKLMILQSGFTNSWSIWIWSFILIASLLTVVGFSQAGSTVFWKAKSVELAPQTEPHPTPPQSGAYIAVGGLVAMLVLATLFAGQIHSYTQAISAQLFAPDTYTSTVFETTGKLSEPHEGTH